MSSEPAGRMGEWAGGAIWPWMVVGLLAVVVLAFAIGEWTSE